mmetsp:Transcript_840/g.1660  ORF Transcript_840/g.1660 Transcript_840/m.1660 type:complete len:1377 (+) Transcript_840:236-4366(+)
MAGKDSAMVPVASPDDVAADDFVAHAVKDVEAKVESASKTDKGEAKDETQLVSALAMFKFCSASDVFIIIVGLVSSALQGAAMPLFSVLLGGLIDDFIVPDDQVVAAGAKYAKLFSYVATGITIVSFFQVACFTVVSERVTLRIRKLYLDSILRQEIAFFDEGSGELSSRIAENTVLVREALGEKLGQVVQFLTMFVVGYAIGFSISWQLSLAVLAVAPLLAFGGYMMMGVMADATSGSLGAYARAGALAEKSFSMIGTVMAYGLQGRLTKSYEADLRVAEKDGIKKSKAQGFGMGFTMGIYFCSYGLAFWLGAILVTNDREAAAALFPPNPELNPLCAVGQELSTDDVNNLFCALEYTGPGYTLESDADVCACAGCACGCFLDDSCLTGGDVVLVFFSLVIGGMSLGQAAPGISAFTNGRAAAAKIYSILDREPLIDSTSDEGVQLEDVKGDFTFKNVTFAYPTRPDVRVFEGLNLKIEAGTTVACVGGSGSGKSTVCALLQRFYDPIEGAVEMDGYNLRDLNVKWLRSRIGLVSQEPVLFATSIRDNIAYGAVEGTAPTMEKIEAAAKAANAYDFIMEQPDGFDTFVGEAGSTMSGGQKQRIAIARAMLRDPSILILDEATSALDNVSERIVQAALDDLLASRKRTTIVVAHRLTTVRNADKIVVFGRGGVLEQGSHDDLVKVTDGYYNALLAAATRSETRAHRKSAKRASKRDMANEDVVAAGGSEEEAEMNEVQALGEEDDDVATSSISAEGNKSTVTSSKDSKKSKKEELYKVPLSRIFKYSYPERMLYIPGIIASALNGAVMPLFAILFSEITTIFVKPTAEEVKDSANLYAIYFVVLGFVVGISYYGAFLVFGLIGERMTTRVRAALFKALLQQDMAFYDDRENSVGSLTSRLSTDAALVKATLADRLNLIVMNVATVFIGLGIAFYNGWKLTLVLFALMPLMIIGGMIQTVTMTGAAHTDSKSLASAGQVLSESVNGIRTVTAFGLGDRVVKLYDDFLRSGAKNANRKGIIAGVGFGFSQGTMFFMYAIAFYVGALFIRDDPAYDFSTLFLVFFAVVMVGMGVGQSAAMTPDLAKAKVAISNVFKVLDRRCEINPSDESGYKGEADTIFDRVDSEAEDIVFDRVSFAYPSRPDVTVFDNFSLKVKKGSVVALVGQSGSGKSSAVKLVERFYDKTSGSVRFNGVEVSDVNVGWLRNQIGLVSQEPALFDTTVFENIAYGVPEEEIGEDGFVPEERVVEAAKAANAHDFIMELPDKYQTNVSSSSLSGGQKQRVALARCLIRSPGLLLLDEATAALDNESEKVVQASLDRIVAETGATTIVVAHRLSTIRNADVIAVVHHGKLVEQGTHTQLLARNGAYAKLYRAQDRSS